MSSPLTLALRLASAGGHVFPLSPNSKRPLGNCPACRQTPGRPVHRIETCPCLPAGAWCHGVRAATTDPYRIRTWWIAAPRAAVALAAGPSGLVLIDIDTHTPPDQPATVLLPGIDLNTEPTATGWEDQPYRDGRDSLRLLARLRGGPHPWPADPAHQPITTDTPSGGRHLWYQAPAPDLRQAVHPKGLAWQVDIKAGWSYGLAPGTSTTTGTYRHTSGDPRHPGRMPDWLAREVIRIAGPIQPSSPHPATLPRSAPTTYLDTVLRNGTNHLAGLTDGRKTALAALAYQIGGYLTWAQATEHDVLDQLTAAAAEAGLPRHTAERIARRALINGQARPLTPRHRSA
jgi:hypothetical protein